MRKVFESALKEAGVLLVVCLAVALIYNFVREAGIPIVAEAEAFRIRTDAEFLKGEDAADLFEQGTAFFVDVREPRFFEIGRVEGALNLPSSEIDVDVEAMTWLVASDLTIIVYASRANQRQAGVVADKLIEMGCQKVFVLHDGIEGWKELGLPTEGQAGR